MSVKIDGLITHWVMAWEVLVEVTLLELACDTCEKQAFLNKD